MAAFSQANCAADAAERIEVVIDRGDAEFDGVEILISEIDGRQRVLEERSLLHRLAFETIGKTLAAGVGLCQFVFVVPTAVLDEMVDVRAVSAVGIAEYP